MRRYDSRIAVEALELRQLLAWSAYAQLVDQDVAADAYSDITGEGVTVAVIDTGVDYTHTALGGGFGAGHKVVAGYDFLDSDADPMDETGHGTGVAGVIAADPYTVNGVTYQGVAPDAQLVALRVGDDRGLSNSLIEQALQWVITNRTTYSIAVVNMSLGSGTYTDVNSSSQFTDELATLRDLGVMIVAASGNSNTTSPINQDGIAYPAADPSVFAVSAVDANDAIATWAQRGDELDLLAPGVNIVMPGLNGTYVTESGTSFASPYVAGTAALLKQFDPTLRAGDIGSILMASGVSNRDGNNETGNTSGLLFSRLDIDAALTVASQRRGATSTLSLGKTFDTALDSQGVLHAAFYDDVTGRLVYATRSTSGLWSVPKVIDKSADVGAQMSIAVDTTGKAGVGYFDVTNTALKYARYDSTKWFYATLDSEKHIGTNPSLGFDIDGNAYLAYERRSGGYLRLATLNRDTGKWTRQTIAGGDGALLGRSISLDVGEAAVGGSGIFTTYDTTVAIAYSDSTNGDLRYSRLDLDAVNATWLHTVVDDADGVASIDLNLHSSGMTDLLQAQIAYQDAGGQDVKFAYRWNNAWTVETVATAGRLGAAVALSFDADSNAVVTYYNDTKRAIYSSTRSGQLTGTWTSEYDASSSSLLSVTLNERTGDVMLSYLNRARTDLFSNELI